MRRKHAPPGLSIPPTSAAAKATRPTIPSAKWARISPYDGAYRLADFDYEWVPRELDVSLNPIGPAGLAALRNRYGAGVVRFDERY